MILLISIICGVALFLIVFLLFIRRSSSRYQVRDRVQDLRAVDIMGQTAPTRPQQRRLNGSLMRIWNWLMSIVGNRVKAITPVALYHALDRRIMHAGKQYIWDPGTFFFVMMLCGAGLCFLMSGFAVAGRLPFVQRILVMVLIFFCGAFLPWFLLSVMIKKRRQGIMNQLSDMMDLVSVSVQAGLSFDAALAKVGERMRGPMVDECNRMLQDVRMGITRRTALTNMAKRCDVQPVYLFVAAVIQSESLGVSLANTLKIQADNMRDRHRQMVREKAMKLPVKLIFPLAFFIFPTIFIIVLGPIVLTVMTQIGGKGFFGG